MKYLLSLILGLSIFWGVAHLSIEDDIDKIAEDEFPRITNVTNELL